MRRWFARLGALLVLLWLAAYASGTEPFRAWLVRELRAVVRDATGAEVRLADAAIDWRRGGLRLAGLVLVGPRSGREVLRVGHALVTVRWRDGGLAPALVAVRSVRADLVLKGGEAVDLPGLRSTRGGGPPRLPWRDLLVEGADLRVAWEGGEFRVQGVEVRPDIAPHHVDVALDAARLEVGDRRLVFGATVVRDVQLGPDRIVFGDLELVASTLALTAGGSIDLAGPLSVDARVEWDPAFLATGGLVPRGRLAGALHVGGTLAEPRFAGPVSGGFDLLDAEGELLLAGGAFTARLHGEAGFIGLERLSWRWAGGEVAGRLGVDLGESRLDGALELHGLGLSRALAMARIHPDALVDLRASGSLDLSGTLEPFRVEGAFDLLCRDLRVWDARPHQEGGERLLSVPSVQARGRAVLTPEVLRFVEVGLASARGRGRASGWLGLDGEGFAVQAVLDPIDLRIARPFLDLGLAGEGRLEVRLEGPFDDPRLAGLADIRGLELLGVRWGDRVLTPFVAAHLDALDFPGLNLWQGESLVTGSIRLVFEDPFRIEIAGRTRGARLADLLAPFVAIPGLDGKVTGSLDLAGPPEALTGRYAVRLEDVDLFGERFPRGRASGTVDEGVTTLSEFLLQRAAGRETLLARGTFRPGLAMDIDLHLDGMELSRSDLLRGRVEGLDGRLRLDARVGGTLDAPRPAARLELAGLRLGDQELGTVRGLVEPEGDGFDFALGGGRVGTWIEGHLALAAPWPWTARAELDGVPLDVFWSVAADGRPVEARATGTADLSGVLERGWEGFAVDLRLASASVRWDGQHLRSEGEARWVQRGRRVEIDGLRLRGGATDLVLGGVRTPGGGRLTAAGRVDLAWLRALESTVERAEGTAEVAFTWEGSDPPRLRVRSWDATVLPSWFEQPFERAEVDLALTPTLWRVERLSAHLGGGTVDAAGTVAAEGWAPRRVDLTADVRAARVQVDEDLPPLTLEGRLALAGPADHMLLTGELAVLDMTFAERMDWEAWVVGAQAPEPLDETASDPTVGFDVHLVADGTIRLRNNLAQGLADADLRLVGDDVRPGLAGDVRMRPGGRLRLQDRSFEVLRGELHYTDPFAWDPELAFELQTRIASRDRSWRVRYQVDGRFSDWRTTAWSDPPLPEADINALVLFGMTRDELERYGAVGSVLAQEGADLLAYDAQRRLLGSLTPRAIKLDRIDLVTGVSARSPLVTSDWRLLVEKDLGPPTGLRVTGEFNLTHAGDNYISLERAIGSNLYLTLYWSSVQRERSLPINGAYGLDFVWRWEVP